LIFDTTKTRFKSVIGKLKILNKIKFNVKNVKYVHVTVNDKTSFLFKIDFNV